MGCQYCTSGLGKGCQGPRGLDDVEIGCDCDCHRCEECGSAFCYKMGGPDNCTASDSDEGYEAEMEERYLRSRMPKPKDDEEDCASLSEKGSKQP